VKEYKIQRTIRGLNGREHDPVQGGIVFRRKKVCYRLGCQIIEGFVVGHYRPRHSAAESSKEDGPFEAAAKTRFEGTSILSDRGKCGEIEQTQWANDFETRDCNPTADRWSDLRNGDIWRVGPIKY
jgi:hypothetical protein